MKLIGIGGTNGSGKDTVSKFLDEEYGFFVGSATDMLEAELKKLGWPTDRMHKRKLGNQWRREFGLGFIVQRAVDQAKKNGYEKVVVASLRNPGEVELVHKLGGKMIWVDADPKIRYKRIQQASRGRVEDNKSFEEFLKDEQEEMAEAGDDATLKMAEVKKLADIFLENNYDDITSFTEHVKNSLKNII